MTKPVRRHEKISGTLHDRLVAALRAEFAELPIGSRIPSGQELSRRFDVAYMTINRALDTLVEHGEIIRRRGDGSFTARALVRTVYYLVPQRDCRDIDTEIFRGALAQAHDCGIQLQAVPFSTDNTMLNVDFQSLRNIPEYSAVIVQSRWFYNGFDFLNRRHCRVVYVEQFAGNMNSELRDCRCLRLDRAKQLLGAVRLLKNAGAHRIFLVTSNFLADDPVRSGFREALRQEGLEYDERQVMVCSARGYDSVFSGVTQLLLRGRFDYDAMLTQTTSQALAVYDVLTRQGVGIPTRCALLSLAEREILSSRGSGITSLAFNEFDLGRRAVRLLAEGAGPTVCEVPFQLVRRGSVKIGSNVSIPT